MTDETERKPKQTISLNVGEWQNLVLLNLAQLHEHLKQHQTPTDAQWKEIDTFLSRVMLQMSGWSMEVARLAKLQPQAVPLANPVSTESEFAPIPETNGAAVEAAPRKRGGWPPGKKRGPRKTAEVVQ